MAVYKRYKRKPKKPPKIKQTELQSTWEQRIWEAEVVKGTWKREYRVDDLQRAYEGDQNPEGGEDYWFIINLIFSSIKVLKRNITPRELQVNMRLAKSFLTNPEQIAQLQQIVKVRRAVLQYSIDQMKLWKSGQLAYLNSLWQFGVIKVGYSADMIANPNAGGILRDNNNNIILENGQTIEESEEVVQDETFFIDDVDPDNFLVDRYCRNSIEKTGRWVAEKSFRPLEEIQADPSYTEKAVKNLGPSSIEESELTQLRRLDGFQKYGDFDAGTLLPENEIVVVYEIYDLVNKEVLSLARGAHDLLSPPGPLPPGVDSHPFITLKFNERRGSWYPIPVVFNWMGPQEEYNITRNQIATHRKRFNRKYGYIEGKIDVDELEKLQLGEDGTVIRFNTEGAIEVIKDAPLDQAVYFDTRQLKEEFMEVSGVGQLQRNQVGAESATEAEIVERRSRESEIDEHEEMMDFLTEVIKKLHDSMEANLTQDAAVELIGPEGAKWLSFGPEHFEKIAGEIFFKVQADEAARVTLQVERAQLLQLLDLLGKNPLLVVSEVLLRALFDKFPALGNNELLIQEVRKLGIYALRMQALNDAQAGQGKGSTGQGSGGNQTKKPKKESSTGGEASKSRKVVSK